MKLHLPSLLRKALLTCISAVGIAAPALTICSGVISVATIASTAYAADWDGETNPIEGSYTADASVLQAKAQEGQTYELGFSGENSYLTISGDLLAFDGTLRLHAANSSDIGRSGLVLNTGVSYITGLQFNDMATLYIGGGSLYTQSISGYGGHIAKSDAASSATVEIQCESAQTLNGIVFDSGVKLVKAGVSQLTMRYSEWGNNQGSGELGYASEIKGDLEIQDGTVVLDNTSGRHTGNDEDSIDFHVGGDVTISGDAGLLQAQANGRATWGNGELTIDGSVTINNTGSVTTGAVTGLSVGNGGIVTINGQLTSAGNVTIWGGSLSVKGADSSIANLHMGWGHNLMASTLHVYSSLSVTNLIHNSTGYQGTDEDTPVIQLHKGSSLSIATLSQTGNQYPFHDFIIEGEGSVSIGDAATPNTSFKGQLTVSGDIELELAAASTALQDATVRVTDGAVFNMNGSSATGAVIVEDASLLNASAYAGDVTLIQSAGAAQEMNVAGLKADRIVSIQKSGSGAITNIGAGAMQLTGANNVITLNDDNMQTKGGTSYALLFADAASSSFGMASGATLTLALDKDAEAALLSSPGGAFAETILFSNAAINSGGADMQQWLLEHVKMSSAFRIYDIVIDDGDGTTKLIVRGSSEGAWVASVHGNITDFGWTPTTSGDDWYAVLVDADMSVTLEATPDEKHTQLNNLQGSKNLTITNTGDTRLLVELCNEAIGVYNTADTEMSGNVTSDAKTTLQKTGVGTLTMSGNLTVNGSLSVLEGDLVIGSGSRSSVASLDSIEAGAFLVVDGTLSLTGSSSVSGAGAITGSGKLNVQGDVTLGDVTIDGKIALDVAKAAKLTVVDATVASLSGSGLLQSAGELSIAGPGSEFSGSLAGGGTITVSGSGSQQVFSGAGGDMNLKAASGATLGLKGSGRYGAVTVESGGTLSLLAPQSAPSSTLSASSLTLKSGSYTEFIINADQLVGGDVNSAGPIISVSDKATVEGGAGLAVDFIGDTSELQNGNSLDVVLVSGKVSGAAAGAQLEADLHSLFRLYYKDAKVMVDNRGIVLTGLAQLGNPLADAVEVNDYIAAAGAQLLWQARQSEAMKDADSTYYKTITYVIDRTADSPKEASRVMAAVAGSTVTAIGAAQKDALRTQMMRMRDRTGLMGLESGYEYEDMPFYHVWLEGDGGYSKLKNDGHESGYTHSYWGGTFGVDADVSESATLGFSITALYGDLDAKAADSATGKLDNYYLSAMARVQRRKWAHAFIVTGGINRAQLDRTVMVGDSSYETRGSTSGWSGGLMYEATYDIAMNEERTSVLQPLLNLSLLHTSMKGYSEKSASGMGLDVEEQKWTTGSVALGARWIGVVGTSAFERSAQLEVRANVAQDMGDARGAADVALQANPDFSQKVRGAEVGKTAIQAGVGIRVPVGMQSLLYLNGNADVRTGLFSWNVTAGMRYDF